MKYKGITPGTEFEIDQIFSIHYFEYDKNFKYIGESHNFWEFVYVDKGAIEVIGGEVKHRLTKGDIIFHKPNEFHSLKSDGRIAPNLVVMSFSCIGPGIGWFADKVLRISNEGKNFLARIIHEAENAFSSKLNDPGLPGLVRKRRQVFASEHLIKLYLEQFLIEIERKDLHITRNAGPGSPLKEKTGKEAFNRVLNYFESVIPESPSLENVCRETGYSCTYLENLFKETSGRSVMEYYKVLKLERVKDLIREGNSNFTEIASMMNYSSIHYFSKVFKKYTGMTPSEYATSVKLKI